MVQINLKPKIDQVLIPVGLVFFIFMTPEFLLKELEISVFGPPNLPGVYAVCVANPYIRKERILYIGSSKNILKRVNSNKHYYRKIFERLYNWPVYTKSIVTDDYLRVEQILISHVRPLFNVRHK